MTMLELKNYLKAEASAIRLLKSQRKTAANGYIPDLLYKSLSFRVSHVAYCMLRGKTLEQVESNRVNNLVTDFYLEQKFQRELKTVLEYFKGELGVTP